MCPWSRSSTLDLVTLPTPEAGDESCRTDSVSPRYVWSVLGLRGFEGTTVGYRDRTLKVGPSSFVPKGL